MQTLFRWFARLPLPLLHAIGGVLGWVSYLLSGSYRARLAGNAQQAGIARQDWRGSIAEAGRMVAELPFLWLRPADKPLAPPLRWSGANVVDAALERGRGLVLMTPHLGAFEVCAQAYAERWGARVPLTALYRPARQRWLREMIDGARARPGLLTAPASLAGVRQMMRALRRGETVGLLPDQVPPDGMGVWSEFFGRPAYTMTLAARLIQQTGATPLLMVGERLPQGAGYHVHALPLPEPLPDGDAGDEAHQRACAAVINRAMEHVIGRWPQQYLWGYHRYKAPREAVAADAADVRA
jgi:Kdo2-lipid IVA lauroyltransferase/acyltransferase